MRGLHLRVTRGWRGMLLSLPGLRVLQAAETVALFLTGNTVPQRRNRKSHYSCGFDP